MCVGMDVCGVCVDVDVCVCVCVCICVCICIRVCIWEERRENE